MRGKDVKMVELTCGKIRKTFDICFASGVLYHMRNPAELIALIARATDRVLLWTHYMEHPRS